MSEKFKQYAVFIDIDGTLMGKSDQALKENIDTIQKVRSLGHKVFISTGRAQAFLPEKLNIEKNFDGVSSGAGSVVTLNGEVILKRLMPHSLVEIFCQFSAENNIPGILEGEKNLYFFGGDAFKRQGWIKLGNENYTQEITPDIPIEKFSIMGIIPKGLYELLEEDCIILQHEGYGEIIRNDCGKGKALSETAKKLGIPIERTVAMGDSMNDFDMIEAAGIGVAMGNAVEKIKEIADFVTVDVDEAGVAKALAKIFNLK